ncbi:hypothetical protein HER10_EVM0005389 [Colletotrichum scovillei]|uniref:LYR motif protein n=1 Tax=Colletotrichum scovillei TaxID=1209932 RepID=A0A9P7RH97_9PEZI|nr:uncharacterized protein HER10_EVM0005389 [Colletotrichum scovillei]KAF4773850.1 hypothetical protein HER10_EVM0005389 [Colletotrichum scovillei]KAG7056129.1 LYR motif protein [Colletotrichum scovillei]KAG7082620.1 LYR motif protein [Colletotrichum scovillei]
MQTRIPLPRPAQPLHVYRHLLRSATYFPPSIRPFLDHRIRTAFRDERDRMAESELNIPESLNPAEAREREEDRRKKVLADAKHKLPVLQAALEGDQARLRRVMWHAFGRLGKSRRELMASFVQKAPDPKADPAKLEELAKKKEQHKKMMEKRAKIHPWNREYTWDEPTPWLRQHLSPMEENWDLPKLDRYLRAQKSHQRNTTGAAFPRGTIGDLDPEKDVPEKDGWGRPVALRRVTKLTRKFWKAQADKIMPPVSQADWESLQQLASGEAPPEMYRMLQRRPIAGGPVEAPQDAMTSERSSILSDNDGDEWESRESREPWEWQSSAHIPARETERSTQRKLELLTGEKDLGPYSQARRLRLEHNEKTDRLQIENVKRSAFSKRAVRREYLKMWQATSYMKGAESKAARPVWGRVELELPVVTATHHHFFEGVDAQGRVPKPERHESTTTSSTMPEDEKAQSRSAEQVSSGGGAGATGEPRSKSPDPDKPRTPGDIEARSRDLKHSKPSRPPRQVDSTAGSFGNFKFSKSRDHRQRDTKNTNSSDSRRASLTST